MFDSVLGRTLGAPGRPGLGATVSVGLHVLFLAVALQLSRPSDLGPAVPVAIHFPTRLAGGGRTQPAVAAPTAVHHPAAVRPRPATRPASPALQDVPLSAGPAVGEPGGQPGTSTDNGPGCAVPPCGSTGGEDPQLLTAEMQPPILLSGPEPRYPLAAALEHVGGNLLVRCTVTAEGRVEDCQVLKSLPYLDAPVLTALMGRRYRPALSDGKPVSVRMVIPVRVIPP